MRGAWFFLVVVSCLAVLDASGQELIFGNGKSEASCWPPVNNSLAPIYTNAGDFVCYWWPAQNSCTNYSVKVSSTGLGGADHFSPTMLDPWQDLTPYYYSAVDSTDIHEFATNFEPSTTGNAGVGEIVVRYIYDLEDWEVFGSSNLTARGVTEALNSSEVSNNWGKVTKDVLYCNMNRALDFATGHIAANEAWLVGHEVGHALGLDESTTGMMKGDYNNFESVLTAEKLMLSQIYHKRREFCCTNGDLFFSDVVAVCNYGQDRNYVAAMTATGFESAVLRRKDGSSWDFVHEWEASASGGEISCHDEMDENSEYMIRAYSYSGQILGTEYVDVASEHIFDGPDDHAVIKGYCDGIMQPGSYWSQVQDGSIELPGLGAGLLPGSPDYLILVADGLEDAVAPLAEYWEGQGLTVRGYRVDASTASVSDMQNAIAQQHAYSGLRAVLLVGDWSKGAGSEHRVLPTYILQSNASGYEYACDAMFGDINGNGMMDLPIGRLPATTIEQLYFYAYKVIKYNSELNNGFLGEGYGEPLLYSLPTRTPECVAPLDVAGALVHESTRDLWARLSDTSDYAHYEPHLDWYSSIELSEYGELCDEYEYRDLLRSHLVDLLSENRHIFIGFPVHEAAYRMFSLLDRSEAVPIYREYSREEFTFMFDFNCHSADFAYYSGYYYYYPGIEERPNCESFLFEGPGLLFFGATDMAYNIVNDDIMHSVVPKFLEWDQATGRRARNCIGDVWMQSYNQLIAATGYHAETVKAYVILGDPLLYMREKRAKRTVDDDDDDDMQLYPNPLNPATTVVYDIDRPGIQEVSVFDLRGRRVKQIYSAYRSSGKVMAQWDGTDSRGKMVSSGVYFVQIRSGDCVREKKVTVVK